MEVQTDSIFCRIGRPADMIRRKRIRCNNQSDYWVKLWKIIYQSVQTTIKLANNASLGREDFFRRINEKAQKRWTSLLEYGMETREFRQVDARQISDMILYYYQGLRMWSRVIPFTQETAAYYSRTIRQLLYNE